MWVPKTSTWCKVQRHEGVGKVVRIEVRALYYGQLELKEVQCTAFREAPSPSPTPASVTSPSSPCAHLLSVGTGSPATATGRRATDPLQQRGHHHLQPKQHRTCWNIVTATQCNWPVPTVQAFVLICVNLLLCVGCPTLCGLGLDELRKLADRRQLVNGGLVDAPHLRMGEYSRQCATQRLSKQRR